MREETPTPNLESGQAHDELLHVIVAAKEEEDARDEIKEPKLPRYLGLDHARKRDNCIIRRRLVSWRGGRHSLLYHFVGRRHAYRS